MENRRRVWRISPFDYAFSFSAVFSRIISPSRFRQPGIKCIIQFSVDISIRIAFDDISYIVNYNIIMLITRGNLIGFSRRLDRYFTYKKKIHNINIRIIF